MRALWQVTASLLLTGSSATLAVVEAVEDGSSTLGYALSGMAVSAALWAIMAVTKLAKAIARNVDVDEVGDSIGKTFMAWIRRRFPGGPATPKEHDNE